VDGILCQQGLAVASAVAVVLVVLLIAPIAVYQHLQT